MLPDGIFGFAECGTVHFSQFAFLTKQPIYSFINFFTKFVKEGMSEKDGDLPYNNNTKVRFETNIKVNYINEL